MATAITEKNIDGYSLLSFTLTVVHLQISEGFSTFLSHTYRDETRDAYVMLIHMEWHSDKTLNVHLCSVYDDHSHDEYEPTDKATSIVINTYFQAFALL